MFKTDQSKIEAKWLILFFGLVFLLSLFLYHNNLSAYFVSDDFDWLYNTYQRNPLTFFLTNSTGQLGSGSYGPIVSLVYYFSYQLGQLNPLPYHLFSFLFHFGNIILIYFLAKHFFGQKTGLIASLLFAVYFNNAEAVSWIAAIPHVSATFFYLLVVYCWLKFINQNHLRFLFLSLAFFGSALLAKEIVITLPFIILILYFWEAKNSNLFIRPKKVVFTWIGFWLILVLYLLVRYSITGILFGYYGRTQFNFDWLQYLKNLLALVFTFGSTNILRFKLLGLVNNHLSFAVLGSLVSLVLVFLICKKRIFPLVIFLLLFGFSLLPYITLPINPLTNEAERYLYLPVILLIIVFSWLLFLVKKILPRLFWFSFLFLLLVSGVLLYEKNQDWCLSSQIAQKIIADFASQVDLKQNNEQVVFIYLPDNLNGAQIFRNAIVEAIKLNYPNYSFSAKVLPVYIMLSPANWQQPLFSWKNDGVNRILGKTVNGQRIVTGFDRREDNDIIFELWGYDYKYYITDKIFIQLKDGLIESNQQKKTYFFYFDSGGLKLLDDNLFKSDTGGQA